MAAAAEGGRRRFPGTLLLAQDLGLSATGKRRFSVAGEVVDIPVTAIVDALVGDYPDLLQERQHHRDLWEWCMRGGHMPPAELRPK